MIKVIIVDDSVVELNGLIKCVDWKEIGLEIIGTAMHGVEALELINDLSPDIVISDIRMPVMDGIELAEQIHNRFGHTRVVFLSAYEDFGYAKKGIELGVDDYIMKPVRVSELKKKLVKVVEECKKHVKIIEEQERIKRLLNKSMPLLRDRFMLNLVENKNNSDESLSEGLAFLEYEANIEADYQVVVIRIETNHRVDYEERLFGQYMVAEQLKDCASLNLYHLMPMGEDHIVMVLEVDQSAYDGNAVDELFVSMAKKIKAEKKLSLIFFSGRMVESLQKISDSYTDARDMEAYRLSLVDSVVNHFKDFKEISKGTSNESIKQFGQLDESISMLIVKGDKKSVNGILKIFFDEHIGKGIGLTNQAVMNMAYYVYSSYIKTLSRMNYNIYPLIENDEISIVKSFNEIEEVWQWLGALIRKGIDSIGEEKTSKNHYIAKQMHDYIQNHYSEEITLVSIAEVLFLSPNYLGAIFKEQFEVGFLEYLIMHRMKKATELLKIYDKKVYEVAEEVGYNNVSYFSAKFKKHYGMTPKEYREKVLI